MRSRHVERFNHDAEAAGYDRDVRNEDDPIRSGYAAVLDWVALGAGARTTDTVADLGAGTGNLSRLLGPVQRLVCVDASAEMLALAAPKLPADAELIVADLLEYASTGERDLDVAISTYAIHHLTDDEKDELFRALAARLHQGGRFVAGDLMFASRDATVSRRGDVDPHVLDELLGEEFPWFVDEAADALARAGFRDVCWQRFSALSWTVSALAP